MSLLDTFENINVSESDMISEHDHEVCKGYEQQFNEALHVYHSTLEQYKKLFERYPVDEYGHKIGIIDGFKDIDHVSNRISSAKGMFIKLVCKHFENTYKITINHSAFKLPTPLSYLDIVKAINDQLGGLNFEEKAVEEIKRDIQRVINCSCIEVKKRKVLLPHFISIDSYWKKFGKTRIHFGEQEKIRYLAKALSHYEFGYIELHYQYIHLLNYLYRNEEHESLIFTKHEMFSKEVTSITLRKNGKIEIEFVASKNAEQFASNYLGWTGAISND